MIIDYGTKKSLLLQLSKVTKKLRILKKIKLTHMLHRNHRFLDTIEFHFIGLEFCNSGVSFEAINIFSL